jgi:hypothetical protein
MSRPLSAIFGAVLAWSLLGHLASAAEPLPAEPPSAATQSEEVLWNTSYDKAVEVAKQEGKMMLICFHQPGGGKSCDQFSREALADPAVGEKLKRFVTARLPLDAKVRTEKGEITLIEHGAFREMLGRPGVAILDFADKSAPYYGQVVSTFPFLDGRPYTAKQVAVMLDLPAGTLTQRTLIYAVRTHPDAPASTTGRFDPYLAEEACSHSAYQARVRVQGHQGWEWRFQRINARLPGGLLASEVCAESWPGESLVEAAIDCVGCWRSSSGHWRTVRARHPVYAYDMKRGSNGVWYATGIFGRGTLASARKDDTLQR